MSENLQLNVFGNEPVIPPLTYYQAGSPANRTALQESVWHLLTTVTCGAKCGESFANFAPDGLLLKMCGDCYLPRMDGSLQEFCGIFPTWGMMLDGVCYRLPQLEPYIDENGWRLLPTLVTSDYKGGARRRNSKKQLSNLKEFIYTCSKEQTKSIYLNPPFLEEMMGFPIGWTELKH